MDVHDRQARLPRPAWLPDGQWPFPLRQRSILGNRVHYVDVGEGPALLFVHAGMWSFVWRDVIAALSPEYRCVALDFPGSGLSEARPGYRIGLVTHAEVLADLVRQLDLTDITLVLHDLGGPIGLELARARPDLVRALVITQSFGWWPRQRLLRRMIAMMGGPTVRALNVSTNLVSRLTATRRRFAGASANGARWPLDREKKA